MINDGTRFRTKQRSGMIVQYQFPTTRDIKSADITDGMSQTAAASERLLCLISDQGNSESVLRSLDPRRVLWYPSIVYATEAALAAACATDRQTPYPLDVRPTGAGDTGYDHILPPNVPVCYNSPAIANGLPPYNAAIPHSSLHDNAVNVLLCDGSVRSIMNTIDVNIWRAMGHEMGAIMSNGNNKSLFAVILVCALVTFFYWRSLPKPALSFLSPEAVSELSVTQADGSALPAVFDISRDIVIMVQFLVPTAFSAISNETCLFVLKENCHYTDISDIITVYRQFPVGDGPEVTFVSNTPDGSTKNIAPSPPAKDSLHQQWCAWIRPKSLELHRDEGVPL